MYGTDSEGNMVLENLRRAIFFLVLPVFISACVGPTKAYPGSTKSNGETALIKPQGVTLRRVNGVEISAASSGARILPGANEVELTIDASNFNSPGLDANVYKLKLDAKPGVAYAITGQRGGGYLCAYPINPSTGLAEFTNPAGCLTRE